MIVTWRHGSCFWDHRGVSHAHTEQATCEEPKTCLPQVGHREQVLEGGGWKMLPGLFPIGKALELDVSYKVPGTPLLG